MRRDGRSALTASSNVCGHKAAPAARSPAGDPTDWRIEMKAINLEEELKLF